MMITDTGTYIFQPEELRTGNYVRYGVMRKILSVVDDGGGMVSFHNYKDGKKVHIHNVEPELITTALLEKMPDIHFYGKSSKTHTYLAVYHLPNQLKISLGMVDGIMLYAAIGKAELPHPPKYVHELQNLVYELSKSELQIIG